MLQLIFVIGLAAGMTILLGGLIWIFVRTLDPFFQPPGTRSIYWGLEHRSWLQVGQRRWRVTWDDLCAARALDLVLVARSKLNANGRPPALLSFRSSFAEILRHDAGIGLVWCLGFENVELRRMALLLLRRLQDHRCLPEVRPLGDHADCRLRRDVARTLRRLQDWAALEQMAADPDERVRRIASCEPAAPFAARLKDFMTVSVQNLPAAAPRARMPLRLNTVLEGPHPPKSVALIRRLLRRIHRLVGLSRPAA